MASGATPARLTASAMAMAARSSGRTSLSVPAYLPIGVRTAARITTSSCCAISLTSFLSSRMLARSRLLALPLRLALLQEGRHAFLLVVGRKEEGEEAFFIVERGLQRRVEAREDRLLDESGGDGSLRGDLARQRLRLLQMPPIRDDMVDEAPVRHLLSGELVAGE